MADLYHECGIAAIYHLPGEVSRMAPKQGPNQVSRLMPRLLLEIQNRGQLAAGMSVYRPGHPQLLDTYKNAKKFGEDKVSYTFRIVYRSFERTLTNEEVNAIQDKIIEKTKSELKAVVR